MKKKTYLCGVERTEKESKKTKQNVFIKNTPKMQTDTHIHSRIHT